MGGFDVEPAGHGLGRTRGGFTTKLHLVADQRRRPLAFVLTPGRWADCPQFTTVLAAANAFRSSAASTVISRDTVGSEATAPNMPGSPRNNARSETQSPPSASITARSHTILPGSWTAPDRRHGANFSDNTLVSPVLSAVRSSNPAPACDTTGDPPPAIFTDGYHDIDLLTERLLPRSRFLIFNKSIIAGQSTLSPNTARSGGIWI